MNEKLPNRIKLTPGGVKQLPLPASGKVIYWDTQLPGFGVRTTPTSRSYIVRTRIGGKRVGQDQTVKIGKCNELPFAAARTKAMAELSRMRDGINVNKEEESEAKIQELRDTTLAQLFDDYVSKRDLRPRTKKTYEDALRLCVPDWSAESITTITRDMIETRLQQVADEPGSRGNRKAQAAQCFTLLRALFRFAADRYEVDGKPVIEALPTRSIAKGKSWSKVTARDVIVAESDLPAWYKATEMIDDDVLIDYVQFLLFSGMRRTECLKLKWSDIDKKEKVLTVPAENAKTGKKREIPLTNLLLGILERRHGEDTLPISGYVFPGKKPGSHLVEPRRAADVVRKEAKIDFCFHDLRRTYITHASRLIPYPALKALVGHTVGGASSDVTQRHYLRLDMESLKPEAQKVADWFKAKCGVEEISQEQSKAESLIPVISGTL